MGYASNGSSQVGGGFGNRNQQTVRNLSAGGVNGENIDDIPALAKFCYGVFRAFAILFVIFGFSFCVRFAAVSASASVKIVGVVCSAVLSVIGYLFITRFSALLYHLVLAFYRLYQKKMSQM